MVRRVARLAVPMTLLVTVLTMLMGCGGGDDRLPPAEDPVAWAGRLCASLSPLAVLNGHPPRLDPIDPARSVDTMRAYFEDIEDRAGQSLEGLDQAGPSPVPGGDDAAAKLRDGLTRLRTAYAAAGKQAESIDRSDPLEIQTRMPEIMDALSKESADRDLAALSGSRELNDAIRQAPSCQLLPGPLVN